MDPVVVVGAGISGIGCAATLAAAGLPVRVLDRAGRAGGRMATAEHAGLRFEVATATEPVTALVDRGMWSTIVTNLLSNAMKFTPSGGVEVADQRHTDLPVGGLADDVDVALPTEHQCQRRPDQRVVVDEQHPDHAVHGSHASSTNVAPSFRCSSRPPRSSVRSRSPTRPRPAPGAP